MSQLILHMLVKRLYKPLFVFLSCDFFLHQILLVYNDMFRLHSQHSLLHSERVENKLLFQHEIMSVIHMMMNQQLSSKTVYSITNIIRILLTLPYTEHFIKIEEAE